MFFDPLLEDSVNVSQSVGLSSRIFEFCEQSKKGFDRLPMYPGIGNERLLWRRVVGKSNMKNEC